MVGRKKGDMHPAKRRTLKEEWLGEAERSFHRFFGDDTRGDLGTFRQIEASAVEEGDRLARWFLEKKIRCKSVSSKDCLCPVCKKPAQPKKEGLERREIIAKPGVVGFDRPGFYCPSCRKVFFPSGPEARSEIREL